MEKIFYVNWKQRRTGKDGMPKKGRNAFFPRHRWFYSEKAAKDFIKTLPKDSKAWIEPTVLDNQLLSGIFPATKRA